MIFKIGDNVRWKFGKYYEWGEVADVFMDANDSYARVRYGPWGDMLTISFDNLEYCNSNTV